MLFLLLIMIYISVFSISHVLRYAGILLGITNTFGTVPGVIAPIAVGQLAKDVSCCYIHFNTPIITHQVVTNCFPYNCFSLKHSLMGWRKVFLLSAGLSVFGALYYTLFGTGKIQPWALRENQRETREKERKH